MGQSQNQDLKVIEININGTTFYSTSGNASILQLEGMNCQYFITLNLNPVCLAYVENYPENDGFCNLLDPEEAVICSSEESIETHKKMLEEQETYSYCVGQLEIVVIPTDNESKTVCMTPEEKERYDISNNTG